MTDYTQFLATPDQLLPLLMVADNDDLAILVDYITDSGAGRITLAADVCNKRWYASKWACTTQPTVS